ncbi:MAG: hypothetical protein IPH13_18330 [Planctomycetes bacterium]|nr:hypothetical protein [Planctomycetota bacterium]
MSVRFVASVVVFTLASSAFAQLGPWKDGELLIRTVEPGTQTQVLYRLDPATGHGDVLASGFNHTGWAGSVAYDPARSQVLMSTSFPPDGTFFTRLWALNSNGTRVSIPGFENVPLRALCPIGDGRVYFQRNANSWSVDAIEYLDANNVVHPLLDATGASPLMYRAEHLVYHAPTNSLIGTNSEWWSPQDCQPFTSTVFRIPLTPDGSQVAGPIVCAPCGGFGSVVMNIDQMPGGSLLLTTPYASHNLVTVAPFTLAVTPWANAAVSDIDGAYFAPQTGTVLMLDDWTNTMRSIPFGSITEGAEFVTDFVVSSGSSGSSPSESMYEIDLNGPQCLGFAGVYGDGLAGTGGIKPSLTATGCPNVGDVFTIGVGQVVGGASGLLFVGLNPASLPLAGGTLLTFPIVLSVPLTMGGTAGAAGAGSVAFPVLLSDPALVGFTFRLQGAFADPAAIQGASLTNGLQITMG